MKKEMMRDQTTAPRQQEEQRAEDQPVKVPPVRNGVSDIHRAIGNQAVQRLLAQRSGQEPPTQVDDQTAGRIHRARGAGQPLESGVQQQMGQAMGQDFGDVRAHTSREADALSQDLGAKAFTVGKDVFFRQGAYDPGSGEGRELIAHELAHVVQQGSGQVHGGPGMTLGAPGDVHEQQADATARAAASATPQRQEEEEEAQPQRQEEEEEAQPQVEEEEEEAAQPQVEEEEEMPVQAQEEDEGEEIVAAQHEEEEEVQAGFPEQNEEDVPAMRMALQRQEELPEEEI